MNSGRGQSWPQGHILNKLGRGLLDDAIPIIKDPCLLVSDKKILDVSCMRCISLCETCDPRGWGTFWSQWHNVSNFG